jgi:hypothetical protein
VKKQLATLDMQTRSMKQAAAVLKLEEDKIKNSMGGRLSITAVTALVKSPSIQKSAVKGAKRMWELHGPQIEEY